MPELTLYNTLDRKKSLFEPLEKGVVKMYTCGPTVYNYVHIGNLRTFLFEDWLKRILVRFGYQVSHVMNITDVGHLESDADDGEDKLNKMAQDKKKDVWEIAHFYEDAFLNDCKELHLIPPDTLCRATEHIKEMISMIQTLEDKGFTYTVDGNVYFDVSRFPDYTKLGQLDLEALRSGARVDVDSRKRQNADFVLWFSQSKFPNQIMKWDSPWGNGFPGWHIECSAMATKYLGEEIDIHCGAIDLIPVHHTNEVAQAECALGHQWVRWWMHGEFLIAKQNKMSKSSGEFLTLKNFCSHGFKPLHYRYFCLSAHYRSQLSFTWEAAEASRNAFENLSQRMLSWEGTPGKVDQGALEKYQQKFNEALSDDLNLPVALSIAWEVARSSQLKDPTKRAILLDFDEILGLDLENVEKPSLSESQLQRIQQRNDARKGKDWALSDQIRDEFLKESIVLQDTPQGTNWHLAYSD